MSDRELLELAAKAIGKNLGIYTWEHGGYWVFAGDATHCWNPLRDGADALQLVVKLRLELSVFQTHVTAYYATGWCDELGNGDMESATRRAIVRAAAEIGRPLP